MVQQTASDVWSKHEEAVAMVCGVVVLAPTLGHGTKHRVVATYTWAVLIIIRFSVAHLVELRLQNTANHSSSSKFHDTAF